MKFLTNQYTNRPLHAFIWQYRGNSPKPPLSKRGEALQQSYQDLRAIKKAEKEKIEADFQVLKERLVVDGKVAKLVIEEHEQALELEQARISDSIRVVKEQEAIRLKQLKEQEALEQARIADSIRVAKEREAIRVRDSIIQVRENEALEQPWINKFALIEERYNAIHQAPFGTRPAGWAEYKPKFKAFIENTKELLKQRKEGGLFLPDNLIKDKQLKAYESLANYKERYVLEPNKIEFMSYLSQASEHEAIRKLSNDSGGRFHAKPSPEKYTNRNVAQYAYTMTFFSPKVVYESVTGSNLMQRSIEGIPNVSDMPTSIQKFFRHTFSYESGIHQIQKIEENMLGTLLDIR